MIFYWRPPTSNGGSAVTHYTLACTALSFSVDLSANVATYTATGLTDKVNYTFTLTATNAIGTGPAVTFRTVQTGTNPYGPSTVTVSTVNSTTARITWGLSSFSNEATVRWMKIRGFPSTAGMSSFVFNVYPYTGSAIRTGLSTNTYYHFALQAGNDAAQSFPPLYTSTLLFSAPATGGSLLFDGSSAANLSIPNDADFRNGTGDFTIEWFQYATTPGNSFPRIFAMGTYSGQSIGVSQEGTDSSRTFYAWISSGQTIESAQNYTNTWIHFALCRSGTSFRVFKNGTQIGSTLTNSTNFADTTNALRIGNETSASSGAAFKGYITNFRWTKGQALYTGNFTRPAAPLSASANTSLLLLATESSSATVDSSGKGKTVTNGGATWSSLTPF